MAADGPVRFRGLVLIGCLLMIASGFLTWWRAGGDRVSGVELPEASGIGLEGPGLVVYGAALLTLLILNIGYMRGRYGFFLDVPATYLVIGLVAAAALAYRGWELVSVEFLPFPDRAPGYAVAVVGVAFLLYGAGSGLAAGAASRRD